MKFQLSFASTCGAPSQEVDLHSLAELLSLVERHKHPIIVAPLIPKTQDCEWTLEVYDAYIE